MRFDVVTIFPEAYESPLRVSLLGKAIAGGLLEVGVNDLRTWGLEQEDIEHIDGRFLTVERISDLLEIFC